MKVDQWFQSCFVLRQNTRPMEWSGNYSTQGNYSIGLAQETVNHPVEVLMLSADSAQQTEKGTLETFGECRQSDHRKREIRPKAWGKKTPEKMLINSNRGPNSHHRDLSPLMVIGQYCIKACKHNAARWIAKINWQALNPHRPGVTLSTTSDATTSTRMIWQIMLLRPCGPISLMYKNIF